MKVLTLGSFDIPHTGHFRFLRKCQQFGEVVIGLNTDEFVERYKGKRPIFTYQERHAALSEWGYKEIFPNNQADGTIRDVLDLVRPQIIVVGSDWLRKDYLPQVGLDARYLDDNNIWLAFVNYDWTISSTEIKRRINGHIANNPDQKSS